MIPGGRQNPRQMEQMMKRLGMSTQSVDGVEEVIIRTRDKEHVFKAPEVTILTVQGVRTYQVVGNSEVRPRSASVGSPTSTASASSGTTGPPEEDIELVMAQAGAERDEAIEALEGTHGAPAEAIMKILSRRGAGRG
ncbi:MAG: nascent polypeptide-associated complex protein [Thermoplasmata archaeon]|nr:nascent polypeptide-associated complex protein [Thermoplasmata archaeon]